MVVVVVIVVVVIVWSSHKWSGMGSGMSVLWIWLNWTESGTQYMQALDCYWLTFWCWKCRIHALTVKQVDHKPEKSAVLGDFYVHGKLGGILGKCCAMSGRTFKKQNSCSLIKYLRNTARSWASNEQSRVNFRYCHSALVTLLYCWSWCEMTFDILRSLLHLLFVEITCGKVYFMALENSGWRVFLLLFGNAVKRCYVSTH